MKKFCLEQQYNQHLQLCNDCKEFSYCPDDKASHVKSCPNCPEEYCTSSKSHKKCSICSTLFCKITDYNNHMKNCDYCGKQYCTNKMENHFITCSVCNKEMCYKEYNQTHKKCSDCKQVFCNTNDYNNHLTKKCDPGCNNSFCEEGYEKHLVECKNCKKTFCLSKINEHKTIKCDDCNQRFCTNESLNKHYKFTCNKTYCHEDIAKFCKPGAFKNHIYKTCTDCNNTYCGVNGRQKYNDEHKSYGRTVGNKDTGCCICGATCIDGAKLSMLRQYCKKHAKNMVCDACGKPAAFMCSNCEYLYCEDHLIDGYTLDQEVYTQKDSNCSNLQRTIHPLGVCTFCIQFENSDWKEGDEWYDHWTGPTSPWNPEQKKN